MSGLEAIADGVAATAEWVSSAPGTGILVGPLAVAFLWSGAAKVRRPTPAAVALVNFGVVQSIRPRLGRLLGGYELALAGALLLGLAWTAALVPAAVLAAITLLGFAAVIARSLARGDEFACSCFGEEDDTLSLRTLARAFGLAALATAVAWSGAELAGQPPASVALEIVAGVALAGLVVLAGRVPRLRRWNADPFGLRTELWLDRGPA